MKYYGEKICPKCHKKIYGYPAISRFDNSTEICSQCSIIEALHIYISDSIIIPQYNWGIFISAYKSLILADAEASQFDSLRHFRLRF